MPPGEVPRWVQRAAALEVETGQQCCRRAHLFGKSGTDSNHAQVRPCVEKGDYDITDKYTDCISCAAAQRHTSRCTRPNCWGVSTNGWHANAANDHVCGVYGKSEEEAVGELSAGGGESSLWIGWMKTLIRPARPSDPCSL